MALDITPEQKAIGQANFQRAVGHVVGPSRREVLQGAAGALAALPLGAAAYYGYTASHNWDGPAIKAGLIGAGDEGGVLVGEHNPKYLEFIAFSDIRPSNFQDRIFRGEPTGPRRGFNYHYGNDAKTKIRHHEDYRTLLANPEIKVVVIAVPLHLHHQVTMEALEAGKHVLCEKLMAWNITQCKEMIKKAKDKDLLLAVGHQRHYSMLYAHANEVLKTGVLGDVRHIRALWHRNNSLPLLRDGKEQTDAQGRVILRDSWRPVLKKEDEDYFRSREADLKKFGYKNLNELVRWRLYQRTGGGLMAELGSHQLDACSIFLGKKRPIAVTAVGGKNFYQDDREVEDHVYCTYEFPGATYDKNKPTRTPDGKTDYNDVVTVTYSSISTNAFEPYGECIMGSKGTMIVEMEQNAYLFGGAGRSTAVSVTQQAGGKPALDSGPSGAPETARVAEAGQASLGHGPVSRGYREEMEHLAYLVKMRSEGMSRDREDLKPRCDGQRAMEDAIVALTANQAMRKQQRIVFKDSWFDATSPDVPDEDMRVENP